MQNQQHPETKTLNPKPVNPKPLNPKPLNPKTSAKGLVKAFQLLQQQSIELLQARDEGLGV